MKSWVLCFLLGAFTPSLIFSQGRTPRGTVSGTVVDADDKMPVMQATVQVLSPKDSTMIIGNITDLDGKFSLNAKLGKYLLKVSFVGYKPVFKDFEITRQKPKASVGNIELSSDAIMLEEAVIVAQAPEVTAVADTLVYNSSAYRVPEGSALEELVKKLPGAEIDDDGKITINGKEISKIMIDGKEFFADDPNIALKNLPVNIIDKLRAYDKQSDMAKATGIQDGEEETVLDLTVKPGMNKGWFGNADVAGGTQDRYSAKVLLNRFYGGNQFTVIGSSNNVNDNGFPGGGGGGGWRRQNGLNTIHMAGFNFATETEKWHNNGSVNFNLKNSDIRSKSASETFVSSSSSSFTNAINIQDNKNLNLTADFRIEWNPDTMTMVLFRPRFQLGDTDNGTDPITRMAYFSKSVYEVMKAAKQGKLKGIEAPNVAILNDWHAGAVAPLTKYMAATEADYGQLDHETGVYFDQLPTVFIVHNAEHQGVSKGNDNLHRMTLFATLLQGFSADILSHAKTMDIPWQFKDFGLENSMMVHNDFNSNKQ